MAKTRSGLHLPSFNLQVAHHLRATLTMQCEQNATYYGHLEVVKFLVDIKASLDARDEFGR
jgi:hypothetical protein